MRFLELFSWLRFQRSTLGIWGCQGPSVGGVAAAQCPFLSRPTGVTLAAVAMGLWQMAGFRVPERVARGIR